MYLFVYVYISNRDLLYVLLYLSITETPPVDPLYSSHQTLNEKENRRKHTKANEKGVSIQLKVFIHPNIRIFFRMFLRQFKK